MLRLCNRCESVLDEKVKSKFVLVTLIVISLVLIDQEQNSSYIEKERIGTGIPILNFLILFT